MGNDSEECLFFAATHQISHCLLDCCTISVYKSRGISLDWAMDPTLPSARYALRSAHPDCILHRRGFAINYLSDPGSCASALLWRVFDCAACEFIWDRPVETVEESLLQQCPLWIHVQMLRF